LTKLYNIYISKATDADKLITSTSYFAVSLRIFKSWYYNIRTV